MTRTIGTADDQHDTAATTTTNRTVPLVSIGLPTYNRVDSLRRAVESVLAQDYPNVELVVSDDASSDGTQAYGEEVSRRDPRVRYLRQDPNIGLTANYANVFAQSRGDYYMSFADDDWLDPSYVSQCITTLLAHPDYALVCGFPRMFRDGAYLFDGRKDNALQASGANRVVHYLRWVRENAELHGIMRRDTIAAVPPMPNTLAGDWIYLSSIIFGGKSRTLDSVAINKAAGGTSSTWHGQVRVYGLPSYVARIRGLPYLYITWSVFRDIAWVSPVYRSLTRAGRMMLAARAALAILVKFAFLGRELLGINYRLYWSRFRDRVNARRARPRGGHSS